MGAGAGFAVVSFPLLSGPKFSPVFELDALNTLQRSRFCEEMAKDPVYLNSLDRLTRKLILSGARDLEKNEKRLSRRFGVVVPERPGLSWPVASNSDSFNKPEKPTSLPGHESEQTTNNSAYDLLSESVEDRVENIQPSREEQHKQELAYIAFKSKTKDAEFDMEHSEQARFEKLLWTQLQSLYYKPARRLDESPISTTLQRMKKTREQVRSSGDNFAGDNTAYVAAVESVITELEAAAATVRARGAEALLRE
ncbi:hypothetical protein BDV95DRAFT_591584 [Massariosphaeria phaeospora]|uniref:Uncharacterized protein n=1 Tax=Massariosphaeria phaeospora TaxID=100035 RepID=A0A7C8MJH2_9PLEO|nr:hypothetical protein BDV95DRAFT_591584 [Massariosphaeria phaeospora]